MRERLPQSILKRKKIGFDIPAHEWVRGPLRSLVVDTLQNGLSDHPKSSIRMRSKPYCVITCRNESMSGITYGA